MVGTVDPELLHSVERALRSGEMARASTLCQELATKRFRTRLSRIELAGLARRCGQTRLAYQLILPLVRVAQAVPRAETSAEWAEFAAVLIRMGGSEPADKILAALNGGRSQLYRAFAAMGRWDYASAERFAREFAEGRDPDDYWTCVASLNLAAALVILGKHGSAEARLEHVLTVARREGYRLLQANCLEVLSQRQVELGHTGEALSKLEEAERFLNADQEVVLDSLFIRKWKAIALLSQKSDDPQRLSELEQVRDQAAASGHFETVRDCELWRGLIERDPERLARVWFGTPWEPYRQRVSRLARERGIDLPMQCIWSPLGKPSGPPVPYPLQLAGQRRASASARLLNLLASDFFRPRMTSELFFALHPEQRFCTLASIKRMHQCMHRLRKALASEPGPLRALVVLERDGGYSLGAREPISIAYRADAESELRGFDHESYAQAAVQMRLAREFDKREFSSTEALHALGLRRSAGIEALSSACRSGWLVKRGTGRATRYLLS